VGVRTDLFCPGAVVCPDGKDSSSAGKKVEKITVEPINMLLNWRPISKVEELVCEATGMIDVTMICSSDPMTSQ
jgi:hypothetical protein